MRTKLEAKQNNKVTTNYPYALKFKCNKTEVWNWNSWNKSRRLNGSITGIEIKNKTFISFFSTETVQFFFGTKRVERIAIFFTFFFLFFIYQPKKKVSVLWWRKLFKYIVYIFFFSCYRLCFAKCQELHMLNETC